jgi:hypothetical protein
LASEESESESEELTTGFLAFLTSLTGSAFLDFLSTFFGGGESDDESESESELLDTTGF